MLVYVLKSIRQDSVMSKLFLQSFFQAYCAVGLIGYIWMNFFEEVTRQFCFFCTVGTGLVVEKLTKVDINKVVKDEKGLVYIEKFFDGFGSVLCAAPALFIVKQNREHVYN